MKYVIITILIALLLFGCTNQAPPLNNTENESVNNSTQLICSKTCHIDVNNPGSFCNQGPLNQMCTAEYKAGDICLGTYTCQDTGSGCKVVNNNKLNLCISCVKSCNGNMECAQKCANPESNASTTEPEMAKLTFNSEDGMCGFAIPPSVVSSTSSETQIMGAIRSEYPCMAAEGNLIRQSNGVYLLNITTKPLADSVSCVTCVGKVPWKATVSGNYEKITVTYNGIIMTDITNTTTNVDGHVTNY